MTQQNKLKLTKAEGRVAGLISQGYTAEAAANFLGCRVKTISSHLRRIYLNNAISNRVELTRRWIQEKYVIVRRIGLGGLGNLPEGSTAIFVKSNRLISGIKKGGQWFQPNGAPIDLDSMESRLRLNTELKIKD